MKGHTHEVHASYGMRLARLMFKHRARNGKVGSEIHIGEAELAALLALAHEAGTELGAKVQAWVVGNDSPSAFEDALDRTGEQRVPLTAGTSVAMVLVDPSHILGDVLAENERPAVARARKLAAKAPAAKVVRGPRLRRSKGGR